ncbi:hypothetical protein D3C73_539930 [compost metagenome]
MKQIEHYVNHLVSKLHVTKEDQAEIKEEWRQHLIDSVHHLMSSGCNMEDAIPKAVQQFGEAESLCVEMNRSLPSALVMNLVKEILIWSILIAACCLAPILLLNANFEPIFIVVPLLVLPLCYLCSHHVLNRIHSFPIHLLASLILYILFIIVFIPSFTNQSWSSIQITHWVGLEGIFTLLSLQLIWLITLLPNLNSHQSYGRSIAVSSFKYWSMAGIGFVLSLWVNSAEIAVLIRNIFVLYVALELSIQSKYLLIWKRKWSRKSIR